jgi:hypothetical protein
LRVSSFIVAGADCQSLGSFAGSDYAASRKHCSKSLEFRLACPSKSRIRSAPLGQDTDPLDFSLSLTFCPSTEHPVLDEEHHYSNMTESAAESGKQILLTTLQEFILLTVSIARTPRRLARIPHSHHHHPHSPASPCAVLQSAKSENSLLLLVASSDSAP